MTIDTSSHVPMRTLNQDDFLKLVVTQLTSQDPMNPQSDTQFIAQMAQFSALEQSKTMQQDIAQLRTEQQFLQANAMLGRVVSLQGESGLVEGVVNSIQVEAGTPKIVVNNQAHDLSDLVSIKPATAP
jgi:flagellar basal-body rod modification protein FlgD